VRVTEYTVSALPEDDVNSLSFAITVAYRGRGLWAVTRHKRCLNAEGEWDWEPLPSDRDDDWLAWHRFDLDVALGLAKEALPRIVVNGMTAADVLARTGGAAKPKAVACIQCKKTPSTGLCCSSHKAALCHRCYRRTHFVEICGSTCQDCAREGLDPAKAVR
jgi:hypothetical protein